MFIEAIRWSVEAKDGSQSVDFVEVTIDQNETIQMSPSAFVMIFGKGLQPGVSQAWTYRNPIKLKPVRD